jgi:hypothetical protein
MIYTGHNFTLLQWLVVEGFQPFNLKLLFRRTRQTLSDKSATASNAGRYRQPINKGKIKLTIKQLTFKL